MKAKNHVNIRKGPFMNVIFKISLPVDETEKMLYIIS